MTRSYIPLFQSIDGLRRRVPYVLVESGKPGPTGWITAAIHGDEVTGTAVVQSLIKHFAQKPLKRGKLYLVPILNPEGFEAISRREQYANADLNRHFGGNPHGTPSERLASLILEAVLQTNPDFVLDLHTDSMNSIAYTIVDGFGGKQLKPVVAKAIALAQTLGLTIGIDSHEAAGYHMSKSFSGQLVTQGVPAVTIELGGPLVVNEGMRLTGMQAVLSVLHEKNLISRPEKLMPRVTTAHSFVPRVNTQTTGVIEYRVAPGDFVKKGTLLGKIRNVFAETVEVIRAPRDCLVFSHEDQSVVFPGLDLFTLADNERTL